MNIRLRIPFQPELLLLCEHIESVVNISRYMFIINYLLTLKVHTGIPDLIFQLCRQ